MTQDKAANYRVMLAYLSDLGADLAGHEEATLAFERASSLVEMDTRDLLHYQKVLEATIDNRNELMSVEAMKEELTEVVRERLARGAVRARASETRSFRARIAHLETRQAALFRKNDTPEEQQANQYWSGATHPMQHRPGWAPAPFGIVDDDCVKCGGYASDAVHRKALDPTMHPMKDEDGTDLKLGARTAHDPDEVAYRNPTRYTHRRMAGRFVAIIDHQGHIYQGDSRDTDALCGHDWGETYKLGSDEDRFTPTNGFWVGGYDNPDGTLASVRKVAADHNIGVCPNCAKQAEVFE